jgi:hypothetical protein
MANRKLMPLLAELEEVDGRSLCYKYFPPNGAEIFCTVSIEDLRTAVGTQRGYGPLKPHALFPGAAEELINSHFLAIAPVLPSGQGARCGVRSASQSKEGRNMSL